MRRRHSEDVELNKKRIAINGHRLPDPIGIGEILTDITKTQWKIGNSIGVGGCGEIYLASDDISKPVGSKSKYVIKVEPHDNGPLFVEMNFYIRAAKSELIEKWKNHFKVKRLGMPRFVGAGSHTYRGMRYRFLVLDRFGEDLSKVFLRSRKRFHIKTAFTLAIQILDILEYVHTRGYIHADIKASNLLLGRSDKHQVYLLDYGLACHYLETNGTHKVYDSDERKAHKGTVEFTSRDAHIGASSRRGDLEILGYNVLQWLCGKLPWEKHSENPELVHEQKTAFMANIPLLLRSCFPKSQPPTALSGYLKYVARLEFDAKPDYAYCKKLMRQGIRDAGYVDDDTLQFDDLESIPKAKKVKKRDGKRRAPVDPENISPKKLMVSVNMRPRQPCEVQNCNRMTRNSVTSPALRFSWEEVISSHPESLMKKQKQKRPTSPPSHVAADQDLMTPSYVHRQSQVGTVATPAMLQVIRRQWIPAVRSPKRKSKHDSLSLSPVPMPYGIPTPEMDRIIQWRNKLTQLETSKARASVKEVSAVLSLRSGKTRMSTPIVNKQAKKSPEKVTRKITSVITSRKASVKRCTNRNKKR